MSAVTFEHVGALHAPDPVLSRLRANAVSLLATAAVLLGANGIIIAYRMAEESDGHGHFAVFWASYAVALLASLAVALRARSNRGRVTAIVGFGLVTFLPKLLMTLDGPRYFDEYGHWRHANDIVDRVDLLVPTPYLPIQRGYPGLEALTAAIHWVTNIPTWHAGQLIVGLAHCGVLVVIWWMARLLDLPQRAAVVAAFLYALNPSFLYFDTQYSYESLALPLAFTAVAATIAARRADTTRSSRRFSALAVVVAGACIVSHHSSTFVMVGLLVLVAAFVPGRAAARDQASVRCGPWVVAALSIAGTAAWLLTVARPTYGYLEPHVRSWLTDAGNLLQGERTRTFENGATIESRRRLFAGSRLPAYELVFAFLAPLLAVGSIGLAVAEYRRDRAEGRRRLRLLAPFHALVLLYLVSIPLALTATGGEGAHRAWGYAYLGVAVVIASGARQWDELVARFPFRRLVVAGAVALLVVAVGNTAAGANIWYRFPGPERFGTDTRSRGPELDALAGWLDRNVPAGSKVVTDRFTGLAVIGYTDLRTPSPSEYLVYRLYREGGRPTPRLRAYLRDNGFRYFVLDRRIGRLEPEQRLFQGYVDESSVSPAALRSVGTTPFLRVVHETPTYRVLRIVP
jgi:hypothetical protein